MKKTMKTRILERVDKTGSCWLWTGGVVGNGYGALYYKGRSRAAHRVSWEIFNDEEIPEDICVLHKCDVRLCVNPNHLFLGTKKDNTQDMFNKGRECKRKGEHNGNNRLTVGDVKEIRKLHATGQYLQTELRTIYPMSCSHMSRIINKQLWKHI